MLHVARQLPMDLGRRVHHRSDAAKAAGIIVGWILSPSLSAVVRWQGGTTTFEAEGQFEPVARATDVPPSTTAIANIRSRIISGILPVTAAIRAVLLAFGQWEACDGCDDLIAPRQAAYALKFPALGRIVRLHIACHRLWEAECVHRGQRRPAADTRDGTEVTCGHCEQGIEARQNVVFRADGRVVHVTCVTPLQEPRMRLVPKPVEDPTCPACSQPIRPRDPVAREGVCLVHVRCLVPHPIAGGVALPAWRLIGDEHIGRDRGRTRGGHLLFLEACADARLMSRDIASKARRVVAATRAIRDASTELTRRTG